jgi:hypothetical protein
MPDLKEQNLDYIGQQSDQFLHTLVSMGHGMEDDTLSALRIPYGRILGFLHLSR